MKTMICRLVLCSVVFGAGGAVSAERGTPYYVERLPTSTAPAGPDSAAITALVAAARTAAGPQWEQAADYFCDADPRVNDPSDPQLPPTKVFDNLYYVGGAGTGSWIVQTSEGLVMIDTGYPQHLQSVLLSGMAALKLNPADVKYILIGHGVWDHWGGAAYFQDKYNTRVLMGVSTPGWEQAKSFQPPKDGPAPAPRIVAGRVAADPPPNTVAPKFDPKRDIAVSGQSVLTVGNTSFTIVDNPGGITIVFPVKDGAVTHMAGMFAATILVPGWRNVAALQDYVQTLSKWSDLTRRMNVDVEIQNHPFYDNLPEKIAAVRAGKKGAEHPFVVGTGGYQRFVNVMSDCMQVQIARRGPAG